jgi:acetyl esterase/lipase
VLAFAAPTEQALPMAELRRRVIAASPLYFVAALPPVQVHHGRSDVAVPVRNAIALRDRLEATKTAGEVHIYDSAGHLLDGTDAFNVARAFLIERLGQRK